MGKHCNDMWKTFKMTFFKISVMAKSCWKCPGKINMSLRLIYKLLKLCTYYLAIHSPYFLNRRDKTSQITRVTFSFICHVNGARLMTLQHCITCFQDEKVSDIIRSLKHNSSISIDLNLLTTFTCLTAHNGARWSYRLKNSCSAQPFAK